MFISSLPFELQARIISFFDIHSIQNFLVAFPEFTRHAVLITDHEHQPNFFGNINDDGLDRVLARMKGDGLIAFTSANPGITAMKNCFIKLVEITNYKMLDAWAKFIDRGLDRSAVYSPAYAQGWLPVLDEGTFVFIHGYNASTTAMFNLRRAILDTRKLTWFMGLPTYPTSSPFRHITNSGALLETRHIVSLRVEGISEFSGFHLPSLRHLMVDFSQGQERGCIKDLTLPSLLTFAVHYRTRTPTFRNLAVCAQFTASGMLFYRTLKRGEAIPHTLFELTDIDACLDRKCTGCDLDDMELDPSSDISFINEFTVLSLNCVDLDRLMLDRFLTCKMLRELRLTVKHPKHYPSRAVLANLRYLVSFVLMILCDNWTVPFQKGDNWVCMSEVQILSNAEGLDLSEVLAEEYLNRKLLGDPIFALLRVYIHQSDAICLGNTPPVPIANEIELGRLRDDDGIYSFTRPMIEVSQYSSDTGLRSVLLDVRGIGISAHTRSPSDAMWKKWRSLKNIDHSKLWP